MSSEKKEHRRGRFGYVSDYRVNAQGDYEYQGDYYEWKVSQETEKKLRLRLRAAAAAAIVMAIFAGCIPVPGTTGTAPYLLIPYALGAATTVSVGIAVFRLCGEKNPMRGHVFHGSVAKLPFRTVAALVFSGGCAVGEPMYILLYSYSKLSRLGNAILFILAEAVVFGLVLYIRMQTRASNWEKLPLR